MKSFRRTSYRAMHLFQVLTRIPVSMDGSSLPECVQGDCWPLSAQVIEAPRINLQEEAPV